MLKRALDDCGLRGMALVVKGVERVVRVCCGEVRLGKVKIVGDRGRRTITAILESNSLCEATAVTDD